MTASEDRSIRLWRLDGPTFREQLVLSMARQAARQLHVSPDGKLLCALFEGERGVRVVDLGAVQSDCERLGIRW